MLGAISDWFSSSGFMPHGYCFQWTPALLWIDVPSDLITAASYLSIPFALWYFVRKRLDVPFRWVFVMFGVFVMACGSTHFFEAWNIWHTAYWAEAIAKAITATASIATAILLWPLIPKALTIPSRAQLESTNRELQSEATRRRQAEQALLAANEDLERRVAARTAELRAREAELVRFRTAMDAVSDAIYLVDRASMRFVDINAAACAMRGQTREEILSLGPEGVLSLPRAELEQTYDSVISGGEATRPFTITRRRKDGTQITLELRRHAQRTNEGWTIVTVVRDITERKAAEESLRTSEEKFAKAFRSSPMFISISAESDGRYIDVNEGFLRATGHARDEVIGHTAQEISLWNDPSDRGRAIELLHRDGRIRGFEAQLRKKSGESMTCEIWGEPIAIGETACVIWITNDISARKAGEARVQRLTQLYAALSQCNEAIVRCASEEELFPQICRIAVEFGGMKLCWIGLIDEQSRAIRFAARYGDRADDYLAGIEISVDADSPFGRGPTGIAIRENQAMWHQDFLSEPHTAPWHERRARFGFRASAMLPLHRGGVPVGVLTLYAAEVNAFDEAARNLLIEMARDISFALDNFAREAARRQAETNLRAAEEQFRGLVEQSVAGVYIVQDGRFAYVNPRAAAIIGRGEADEVVGKDPLNWIGEADRGRVAQNMRRLIEGETQSIIMDFAAHRGDGTTIQIGGNAARATHHGRPAIIGLLQDISEKKRAEEQIQQYLTQLKTAFMSTVEVATTLSEMRDPYTAGHERRVGNIAASIGAALGLDERRIEGLRVAGYLHDIGKINIPAEILSKPGRLTDIEFQLIKGHPQSGFDVLKDVPFPWPVAQVTLQHHERIDGSGYPQGLKGEAILFEARILAVADVMEAMSSHRPYRPGLGLDKALAEIERGRGTAYDAAVVDACLRMFRHGYRLPE